MSDDQSTSVTSQLNKIFSYLSSFQADSHKDQRRSSVGSTAEIDQNASQNSQLDEVVLPSCENLENSIPSSFSSVGNRIRNYYAIVKDSEHEDLTAFGGRLHTFGENGWVLPTSDISVYEIVRRGWYLHKPLLLRCSSCCEILPAKLPEDFTCKGYTRAVNLLKERVATKHNGTCQFSSITSHESLSKPPVVLSPSHFFVLSDAAHVLLSDFGGEKIPYFDFSELLIKMELERSQLTEIFGSSCSDLEVTALMLIFTGWKKSPIANTIRCELCKRDVALKSFVNHEEYLEIHSRQEKEENKNSNEETVKEGEMVTTQEEEITDNSGEDKNENNKRCRSDSDDESNEPKRNKSETDKITFSKPVFCPLSQHRYWCAWINTIKEDCVSKGFNVFSQQIKTTLQLTSTNNWISSPKYSSNVDGLRSIRSLLNSWTK